MKAAITAILVIHFMLFFFVAAPRTLHTLERIAHSLEIIASPVEVVQ